jgi:hypothetical protein
VSILKLVSVLCASKTSVYKSLDCVDVFDIDRDCRSFDGSTPVVAHPPCRSWSAFCRHQSKATSEEKELAPWCVEQVRQCGGVLEHPAHSTLWAACNLPMPGERERNGLWSMWVDQSWFGDTRSKSTWLLFSGVSPSRLEIPFRLHDSRGDRKRWNALSKRKRAQTPKCMADWLVSIARESFIQTGVTN